MTAPQLSMKDLRRVVIAAAVGNVIEWYDFYIFGSLATLLATKFFAAGASGSALIKYVGTFTAGFLIRPFGAFLFGRVGDARNRAVADGDRRDAGVARVGGVRSVGVADSLRAFAPHGRDRDLHPSEAPGDADLPGHQGQGPDVEQSVARGVLGSERQIRADRERRRDR